MDENGFELYDVLTAPYVKNSGGVEWNGTVFIDGYFLRKDLVPKIR